MADRYSSYYDAIPSEGFSSGAVSSTNSYVYKGPGFDKPGQMVAFAGTVSLTSKLLIGEKVKFFDVPAGFRLASINLEWEDLDTDASPAVDCDVGLTTQNADAYLNGGTVFQSADSTAAGNGLTENATELVFDEATTTAADSVGMTVIASATAMTAPKVVTFRAVGYLA